MSNRGSRRSVPARSILVFAIAILGHGSSLVPADDVQEKRVLWTTSRVHGTPDPPDPYRLENGYPNLQFNEPLAVNPIPGTSRYVVAERHGKIFSFEDRTDATADLLLHLDRTLYGVAAHPRFNDAPYVYVTSIVKSKDELGADKEISRISRFAVQKGAKLTADPSTELTLLEWPAGGHNGGCLRFGPDGYLYLATGDGSGWADWFLTGQRIDDLFASVLRIDVDHTSEGRNYAIPADNPFVNVPNARPEVYSYGHRNSWKFGFDREGQLWLGEVGQDLWEMIYLIKKGGNYGWSVMEGSHPFHEERERGPTPFEKPIIEHNHNDFRSITGGYVYYADDLPDLKGCYIYGDYDTGKVWAFRYRDGNVTDHRQLCDTQVRVIEFMQDTAGRVLVVDFVSGNLLRIVPALLPDLSEPDFPRKLSETGLFASTRDLKPAPGLIPYDVNAPLWSDGANKDRFIAIPGNGKIEFDAVKYPITPPGWRFPDGTVLVKTFTMEMEDGNAASTRRLETRLLHHKKMSGDDDEYGAQVWNGYTYIWNDEQTDAFLLESGSRDEELTIRDAAAPGGARKQSWHYPSRSECALCHTMSAKYVLGVHTLQMNRDFDFGDGHAVNQLQHLEELGVFSTPLPERPEKLVRLAKPDDEAVDIESRARAYLHANCSHCHKLWGGGIADFHLTADLPLDKTTTINAPLIRGDHGLVDPKVIVPGEPKRSMLLHRMELTGLGRMPHVASSVIDAEGVALIREWIESMPVK
jgi:uncharacterized repeat protein (TIGR03806 family)